MAGKTFHGVGGDFDGESPPLGPDGAASPADEDRSDSYSGPTVVDDAKIAESLKRLRSLDLPLNALPGTLIGISVPAVDAVTTPVLDPPSSEATRIDDRPASALLVPPLGRPTAVGHNVGPQVITQQAPPQLDPMRGTMFGHSVHLPDVDAPDLSPDDNSSGMLVVPRPTAEEIKPFLPDRTTRPAQQRDAQPAKPAKPAKPPLAATQVINVAQPLKRVELFHEPESKSTEVVSGMRQRVRGRTAFMVVAIASAAGVAFAWMYSRETNITLTLPPATPAPSIPTATQVLAPRPVAPPKEAVPPTVPSPAVGETPTTLPPPTATETAAREASRPVADTGKPATSRRERHRAATAAETSVAPLLETPPEAKPAEPKTEPKPFEANAAEAKVAEPKAAEPKAAEPKVGEPVEAKAELKPETKVGAKAAKGKKRGDAEEDPDATMAPSD